MNASVRSFVGLLLQIDFDSCVPAVVCAVDFCLPRRYGKFQRECILVKHKVYRLVQSRADADEREDAGTTWERIRQEMFSANAQNDPVRTDHTALLTGKIT